MRLFTNAIAAGCLLLAAISVPDRSAHAENWQEMSRNPAKSIYMDHDSVSLEGDIVRVWTKTIYDAARYSELGKASYNIELSRFAFDCAKRSAAVTSINYRSARGVNVWNFSYPRSEWNFADVPPGSVAENMMKIVCVPAAQPSQDKYVQYIIARTPKADWIEAGRMDWHGHAAQAYFDSLPLKGKDSVYAILVKVEMPPEDEDARKNRWSYVVGQYYLVCQDKKIGISAVVAFDASGNPVESDVSGQKLDPEPLGAGHFLEPLYNKVCSGAGSSESKPSSGVMFGTAWASSGGYVVTAYHVVQHAKRITLLSDGDHTLSATIAASDPANDIAILRPAYRSRAPRGFAINTTIPNLGAHVMTLGFPHPDVMGIAPKLTSGEISALSGMQDDPRILQISVPVQGGNSGGPLINMNGQVVGLVLSKLDAAELLKQTGDLTENVNYALKAAYISVILSELPPLAGAGAIQVRPGASVEDIAAQARKAVYLLVAE